MISALTIENFKAHRSTVIELGDLTILVGANGVGKTSVLEGLHYLSQLFAKTSKALFVGTRAPRTFIRDGELPVSLHASYARADGDANEVDLKIHLGEGDAWTAVGQLQPGNLTINENECFLQKASAHPLQKEASSAVFFRLDARAIARPGYMVRASPRVEYDGANTAAVLASWKLADDERLAKTVEELKRIVPAIRGVRALGHVESDGETSNGYVLSFDFDDARDVTAASVSEGTLVSLAVLTALNAKSQPRLVLLDDLGAELHPTAQGDLVNLLREILDANPKLQIVASTHSPYILDGTTADKVRVFARGADGAAHVKRLDQHPDAGAGSEGLTTGQLWTLDPENWVLR